MNSTMRNGLYVPFAIILISVNYFLKWGSMLEVLVICCLAMIIIKLTDIADAIQKGI